MLKKQNAIVWCGVVGLTLGVAGTARGQDTWNDAGVEYDENATHYDEGAAAAGTVLLWDVGNVPAPDAPVVTPEAPVDGTRGFLPGDQMPPEVRIPSGTDDWFAPQAPDDYRYIGGERVSVRQLEQWAAEAPDEYSKSMWRAFIDNVDGYGYAGTPGFVPPEGAMYPDVQSLEGSLPEPWPGDVAIQPGEPGYVEGEVHYREGTEDFERWADPPDAPSKVPRGRRIRAAMRGIRAAGTGVAIGAGVIIAAELANGSSLGEATEVAASFALDPLLGTIGGALGDAEWRVPTHDECAGLIARGDLSDIRRLEDCEHYHPAMFDYDPTVPLVHPDGMQEECPGQKDHYLTCGVIGCSCVPIGLPGGCGNYGWCI